MSLPSPPTPAALLALDANTKKQLSCVLNRIFFTCLALVAVLQFIPTLLIGNMDDHSNTIINILYLNSPAFIIVTTLLTFIVLAIIGRILFATPIIAKLNTYRPASDEHIHTISLIDNPEVVNYLKIVNTQGRKLYCFEYTLLVDYIVANLNHVGTTPPAKA